MLPPDEFEIRPTPDTFLNHGFIETYFFKISMFQEKLSEKKLTSRISEVEIENFSLMRLRDRSILKIKEIADSLDKHPRCPKAVINHKQIGEGLDIEFDSTDPDDPTITDLKYVWDFGDSTTLETSDKIFPHTYLQEGSYLVKLRVTDSNNSDFGPEASAEKWIDVKAGELGCWGLEVGRYHVNPDGSPGGFVANSSSVEPTVYLDPDVDICGTSQIKGSSRIENVLPGLHLITDTYISDSVISSSDVWMDGTSIVDSFLTANSGLINLYNSEISNVQASSSIEIILSSSNIQNSQIYGEEIVLVVLSNVLSTSSTAKYVTFWESVSINSKLDSTNADVWLFSAKVEGSNISMLNYLMIHHASLSGKNLTGDHLGISGTSLKYKKEGAYYSGPLVDFPYWE